MVSRVSTPENLLVHNLGDEAVILNLTTEKYYTLNGVGYHMWQVLTSSATLDEAFNKLREAYDVEEAILRRDFDTFVENLNRQQLLVVTHEG
jgi:hypothetical protein